MREWDAPRAYAAQNRGVTTNDYQALIYSNFADAQSVSVWGGEDNTPPVYGKIFISVKPKSTSVLTPTQKDYILNILSSKNILTTIPVLVEPDYIEILLNTTVYYNDLKTVRNLEDIRTIVLNTVLDYDTNELQKFDGIFRYSKLSKLIDSSEDSIVNNITTITLKRTLEPKYNIFAEYNVNLINPIYYSGVPEDIVLSSGFYIPDSTYIHYVTDNGLGDIQLFYINDNNSRVYVNNKLGTVNYSSGVITFKNLKVSSIIGDKWYLYIKPSSNDVVSALTQIIQIAREDLVVNVISDKSASGDLRGGKNYTFTTSRI